MANTIRYNASPCSNDRGNFAEMWNGNVRQHGSRRWPHSSHSSGGHVLTTENRHVGGMVEGGAMVKSVGVQARLENFFSICADGALLHGLLRGRCGPPRCLCGCAHLRMGELLRDRRVVKEVARRNMYCVFRTRNGMIRRCCRAVRDQGNSPRWKTLGCQAVSQWMVAWSCGVKASWRRGVEGRGACSSHDINMVRPFCPGLCCASHLRIFESE